jgi:hypothetical protein
VSRLGLWIMVSGGLGLVRLIPEISQISGARPVYWIVVALDAILAFLTVTAGWGIRTGWDGTVRLALWASGIVVATSIGWGILLYPEVIAGFPFTSRSSWILLPRMGFYLLAVAFWPYGAKALIGSAPAESRKSLWRSFTCSLGAGAAIMAGLYLFNR